MKKLFLTVAITSSLLTGCSAMNELAKTGADIPLLFEKIGLSGITTESPTNSKLGIDIRAEDLLIVNTKLSIQEIHARAKSEISSKFIGINWLDNRANNQDSLLSTQPFNVKVKDLYNLTLTQDQTYQAARVVIVVRAVDNPGKNYNSVGMAFYWQGYSNNRWVPLKSNKIAERSFLNQILK